MPSVGWLRAAQERVRGGFEVLDAHAVVRGENAARQDLDVAVVPRVVLVHQPAEPGEVLVVRRLPRLFLAQRRSLLGHRGEPAQDEVGLDRHRLLAPEGAVVVEDSDSLLDRHRLRAVLTGDACDEVDDPLADRPVAPTLELGSPCAG